jgi:hypothetical protein
MKQITKLLFVLAYVASATHSFAGDARCAGKVVVGPVWTTVADELAVCRFKTESSLGKRILSKCPNGVACDINLNLSSMPKDYRKEGRFWTIINWPAGGVERE